MKPVILKLDKTIQQKNKRAPREATRIRAPIPYTFWIHIK